MSKQIMLCAICNVSSGNCSEDCAYCTQSAKYGADIVKYRQKSIDDIVKQAQIAYKNHALGFCLVTAGEKLDPKKLEYICKAARAVQDAVPQLMLIACNGIADYESLKELKNAGVFSYNHNLETSEEFFKSICTTHTWQARYETNENAKRAGLMLCCGGIYGLGESEADRISFRKSLASLEPFTSPINFFISNPALPIKVPRLSCDEALKIIRDSASAMPNTRFMIAGGRELILGDRQYEVLENGASAIVIGDYLTTQGEVPSKAIKRLKELGFSFMDKCEH